MLTWRRIQIWLLPPNISVAIQAVCCFLGEDMFGTCWNERPIENVKLDSVTIVESETRSVCSEVAFAAGWENIAVPTKVALFS